MHRSAAAAALFALFALAACGDAPAPATAPALGPDGAAAGADHAPPVDLPPGVAFETVHLAITGMS